MISRMPPPPAYPGRLVLLGHPVSHSLSPTFQNAALDAAHIALRYEPVDVLPVDVGRTLADLRAVRAAGNVTVPHKAAVAAACDVLTETARAAGAVNTFWHTAGGDLVGDNTDVDGAAAPLNALAVDAFRARSPRIGLIGAGGAASALVLAAARVWPDVGVRVWARRATAAATLARRFPGRVEPAADVDDALGGADLVVNATPLGLRDADALPCAVSALPPRASVFDLVYGVRETAWVRAARAAGHQAEDGLAMLVEQGAVAFARWFGVEPDRDRMWTAVESTTGRRRPGASTR